MVKLDLLNSRLELPRSNHIYDSVENEVGSSSLSKTCTVNLGAGKTKSRKIKLNSIKVPDRLTVPIVTCSGDYIDLSRRQSSTVNYGKKLEPELKSDFNTDNFFSKSASMGETLGLGDFKTLVKGAVSTMKDGKRSKLARSPEDEVVKFETPVLDFLKDRIHEDKSHTIEFQIKKKTLPAPSIAHSRPTVLASSVSTSVLPTPGPGYYEPRDVSLSHLPDTFLNPPRVSMDETKGEIVPLKERLRRERQQQYMEEIASQRERKAATLDELKNRGSGHRKSLKPPKLQLLSSIHNEGAPVSFGTASPRFAGPTYRQQSYIKTTGLILGPDFDKKMEERYQLGPKFSKGTARPEEVKKDVFFDPPDVMRWLSMTAEAAKSPIKYTAAFRPESPKSFVKDRLRLSKSLQRRHSPGQSSSYQNTISSTIDELTPGIHSTQDHEIDENDDDDDDDDAIYGDGRHLGPGAFYPNCAPPSIEIHNPNKQPIPFLKPKSSKSRLASMQEAAERAQFAAMEKERKAMEDKLHANRMQREKLRNMSLLPLVRKKK